MKKVSQKFKIAVVFSEFNKKIGEKLLNKTLEELKKTAKTKIFKVPGALEIPVVCKKIIVQKKYDAVIALGVVIKGETAHFEHVSNESIRGIQRLSLDHTFPIITGIITAYTEKQADERTKNGTYYAKSAIQLINTLKNI
ncbi:6,7-dimethyl-8-ribityllumazine synthase [Candidatus Peregrinibacteria bacterium]|nr:6,7-dimethyl-8-ribityllumazine synthase [Candidatus Peregrinibacteria bacterium]